MSFGRPGPLGLAVPVLGGLAEGWREAVMLEY
jgi:hypothetical protein